MNSNSVFASARPAVLAWLETAGAEQSLECDSEDYILWLYRIPSKGLIGTAELIDSPELSEGGPVLALTLSLDLPPLRSVEDAYALLELNEILTDCSVFARDGEGDAPFALISKLRACDVTAAASVEACFRRLERAKHFIEDED